MFDFGNSNKDQKEAILNTEGPVLISAGPGTGKTATLVKRFKYLVTHKKIKPEQILVATFTEKAAKEIITRISNELSDISFNELYIGTFHSICLKIVKDNLELVPDLRKNFILMDDFDQKYFIYQHIYREFNEIEGFNDLFKKNTSIWNKADLIANWLNKIAEEQLNVLELLNSNDTKINTIGKIKLKYNELIKKKNRLDFSMIQVTAVTLLKNNINILSKYKSSIKYMMIDEYQDSNSIQEKLVFLLSNEEKNICVVGDDDQALYRFRGATIKNILTFEKNFIGHQVKYIKLTVNYRSSPQIVDFYNKWMNEYSNTFFNWDNYRLPKKIKYSSTKENEILNTPIFKISGESEEEWQMKIINFIKHAKNTNKISNYNQIAFLFRSVKSQRVKKLIEIMEENNIPIYSPRSDMFFERREIKLVIGLLIHLFPEYEEKLFLETPNWMTELIDYYQSCLDVVYDVLDEDSELEEWLMYRQEELSNLKGNTDYSFSQLFYQMLGFETFRKIIDTELTLSISSQRAIRNLAILTNLLAKFEFNERIEVISSERKVRILDKLFKTFIRFLIKGGINEYQDDLEYAPSDCVSFLTIHQSKGMEFPIVFVDSLYDRPIDQSLDILDEFIEMDGNNTDFEPKSQIKYFDFWRRYYVAFSRAQNLLILTTPIKESGAWPSPSISFSEAYDSLKDYYEDKLSIDRFEFASIKKSDVKQSYSFTSDIIRYEECSLEYRMFRELGFSEVRIGATLFGSLVHQTIEDFHKAILSGEKENLDSKLEVWFEDNYQSLVESEHSYLAPKSKQTALQYVKNYIEQSSDNWSKIRETEVNLSYPMEEYILNGQIDLIQGEDGTLEIIDFKTDEKPKDSNVISNYERQLQVYAHLVEEKYNLQVSKMKLYYPGEKENPIIEFDMDKQKVNKTIKEFSNVVKEIQNYNYTTRSSNKKRCSNCDMRFYCGKVSPRN